MKTGIYKITNIINGKFYIGSSSYNILNRINIHKRFLKNNNHENNYLQNSYIKYGKNAFIFEIIEECNPEMCIEREQYYLDLYQSYNRDIGYNINLKANSRFGIKLSEQTKKRINDSNKGKIFSKETKLKLSKARKNRIYSKETIYKIALSNCKPILQIKNNLIIKEWDCLKDAEKIYGKGVGKCCRNKGFTCKGFTWKFKETTLDKIRERLNNTL